MSVVAGKSIEKMFHVLFVTGLCLFTQSILCNYVLIQEQKTWYDAQAYCRQNHIDLATIQSIGDWTNVQEAVEPALTSVAWTGLYNDINTWRWSYKEENLTYVNWNSGQPDNGLALEACGVFIWDGPWDDKPCYYNYFFVCYDEIGPEKYVRSTFYTSWSDAQLYCRQLYTDLAIIRSQADNDLVTSMTLGYNLWVGLYRDSWKWSDGTTIPTNSLNWMPGKPAVTGQNQPCGNIGPDGTLRDQLCSDALPFICLTYSKEIIVKMEMESSQNVNDPAVMETILQGIKQKLKDHGIEKNTRLTWKIQTDGNVFSPKND